jgi:Legume lectin domain/PEP-CTERM motif
MCKSTRWPRLRDVLVAVGLLAAGLLIMPAAKADIMGFSKGDPNLWTATHVNSGDPPIFDANSDSVIITSDMSDEHNSVFYSPADQTLPQTRQSVTAFMATFTFNVTGTMMADGAAFVLHNDPRGPQAVGDQDGGSSLGYLGIQSSAAVGFNIYARQNPNHAGTGHPGETDFFFNDQYGNTNTQDLGGNHTYLDITPVELTTNGPITVTLMYDNVSQNLVQTLTDTAGNTFTNTYAGLDLPAIVGDTSAYVGFTGGTGGAHAIQTISSFMYIEMPEPSTAALAAIGIVGTLVFCWRRRNRVRG